MALCCAAVGILVKHCRRMTNYAAIIQKQQKRGLPQNETAPMTNAISAKDGTKSKSGWTIIVTIYSNNMGSAEGS